MTPFRLLELHHQIKRQQNYNHLLTFFVNVVLSVPKSSLLAVIKSPKRSTLNNPLRLESHFPICSLSATIIPLLPKIEKYILACCDVFKVKSSHRATFLG